MCIEEENVAWLAVDLRTLTLCVDGLSSRSHGWAFFLYSRMSSNEVLIEVGWLFGEY